MEDQIANGIREELLAWFASNPPRDGITCAGSTSVVISTSRNNRDENQDRAVCVQFASPQRERSFSLYAVLDGIGGMVDGGKCAEICLTSIICNLVTAPRYRDRITLVSALTRANEDVWKQYQGRGGTTFAGFFIENDRANSVNIGDSHIYQYTPEEGLIRKSSDDRLGKQFLKVKGLENVTLSPDIAERLGQYIGMYGSTRPNITSIARGILRHPRGYILLSSDGVQASGEEFLSASLSTNAEPDKIAEAIMATSTRIPDADNATLVCINNPAILPGDHHYRSPFERLRVWSTQGVFHFQYPYVELKTRPEPRRRKERNKATLHFGKVKTTFKADERVLIKDADLLAAPESQVQASAPADPRRVDEQSKPQVIIRQLTFEPIPDETSE